MATSPILFSAGSRRVFGDYRSTYDTSVALKAPCKYASKRSSLNKPAICLID
ncbi:hypothetical protein Caka_1026 [Coraliomargarita akajimensis DSM 45221]|uniref:Uncharacterized protein n=1 Tax=Coraliomargarita akajimensis (strain DSM 45221 / IAM 15411 / JCM 23193 / KCTC 12865 / 04OKA010-24) TaxID=583355 RepID=D5EHK7_CORAD|nr:hypothetical protein Caka_1026 [Coraliomargarita akajimensis DSM 45221]